jgi:hypothetical protein
MSITHWNIETTAKIFKVNAYGFRWHVFIDGREIVHSGHTKASCLAFCRRHNLPWEMEEQIA